MEWTDTVFKTFKTLLAFVVAALVGSLAPWAYSCFLNGWQFSQDYFGPVLFSLYYMLPIGLPVQFLFQKLGWNYWWSYLLGGIAFGALAVYVLCVFLAGLYDDGDFGLPWAVPQMMAIGAGFGATYALIVWLVRRPDKDHNAVRSPAA